MRGLKNELCQATRRPFSMGGLPAVPHAGHIRMSRAVRTSLISILRNGPAVADFNSIMFALARGIANNG